VRLAPALPVPAEPAYTAEPAYGAGSNFDKHCSLRDPRDFNLQNFKGVGACTQ